MSELSDAIPLGSVWRRRELRWRGARRDRVAVRYGVQDPDTVLMAPLQPNGTLGRAGNLTHRDHLLREYERVDDGRPIAHEGTASTEPKS